MSTEYESLLKEYNIPPGVLSKDQLRLLKQGGIRIDDSDGQDYQDTRNKYTQPRLPHSAVQTDSIKQVYENKLSMKDKQINFLEAQIRRRQQIFEAEKHRIHQETVIQVQRTMGQLRQARARVAHSEGQIPLIKQALNQVRQMLSGMVSQHTYLRLKDLPDRDLPPSQWLLVNVYELVYPYRKQMELYKRQTGQLRQEVRQMNDKQNSLLTELEHYQRLLQNKDDDIKRYTLNYDNNRRCLELELQKLRQQTQINKQKGARYDELFRDYQFSKQQKQLLQEKIAYYNRDTGKDSGANSKLSHDQSQRRKVDLLMQDKQYLTKQNIELIEKNRRLEDRLDRLEAQLLNEKNSSKEYLHQLLNLKTDSVSSYEQKIYREISSLKQKHNHELQMAKNNLVDIYEKQIRFLKESQEEKQLRLEQVQRQLRQKNRQYEQMMIDSRSFQRKFDTDLSQARINLKIKSEELDRINNIYQETLGNLKAHKIENEMLRQKLNCLKGQYYKSQANSKDDMSSLKAQVAVLRQQLANYEIIEKQIDEAIMSLGNISPNDNSIFASTLHSVPTSSKRRIQQALGLAQRLQAKQRQHQQTLDLLRKRQGELQKANDEVKIARSLLDKTNQPYNYLVSNLQQKQRQILALRNQNRKMDQTSEDIKAQYRELRRQLEQAQRDVQRLLVKRQSIQNIQTILIDLSKGPSTPSQIQNAVDNIKQILGGTSGGGKRSPQKEINNKSINQPPTWYRKLVQKK